MSSHFIPRNDGEFSNWFFNLINYVEARTGAPNSEWQHIPAVSVQELSTAHTNWLAAYEPTLAPHIPAQTTEKNSSRAAAERVVRPFIRRFLHWEPVTNSDRVNMGIPNHDKVRTVHFEVNEAVEFEIKLRHIRELLVHFWEKGSSGKAKPSGYDGAVIVWDVLSEPPSGTESLNRHVMASRTPHTLSFSEAERGKTVYIACAWQNERGNLGPYSEILTAFVP